MITRCDQCASATINGIFCHERGCPSGHLDPETGLCLPIDCNWCGMPFVPDEKGMVRCKGCEDTDEVIGLGAVVASAFLENEDDPIEPYYSTYGCDECNSMLGGDRYDIVYRETLDGELFDAIVCVDCYVALCS